MTYSLQRLLLILGLVLIPFYEIFLRMLPFVRNMAPDSRAPKEIIALVFALAIGLVAVWQGTLKPFKNKFFLLIPVYLLISLSMAPHAPLVINDNEVGNFYFWKPFVEILCFMFMVLAISSIEINFDEILKVMVWCGAAMSGYVILQRFGFDQFWMPKGLVPSLGGSANVFTAVRAEALGGNLGQPTIVASWMVMMVPLAVYLRKWYLAGMIVMACLFTQGAMVIGALVVIGIGYAIRWSKLFVLLAVLMIIWGGLLIKTHSNYVINRMDGRYAVWKDTLHDIKHGGIDEQHSFCMTGVGLGRFSFLFPSKHKSYFQQVHNDPLEFTYDCGLIGGFLLLAGIFVMISGVIGNLSSMTFSILLSFIAIFFCSLGTFPFQLGAHQFYAATLVGLLHNNSITRRS